MYLVLLVVVGLVIRHYYLKRNNGEELDELKKIVHSKDADDLIKLQFPIESNMAYSTYYDQNEMRVMLRRPRDLQLKDKKRWTDATTGVPFYAIEIHSTNGLYAGISTLVLRMDSGLDYLKKNMFSNITSFMPLQMFKLDSKMPLSTPQDENLRVELHKDVLAQEGARERELKYLDAFKVKNVQPVVSDISEEEKEQMIQRMKIENAEKMRKLNK